MLSETLPIILDPIFYLAAGLAVTCLGLAKGGFIGFGLVATPLLALTISPLQAAAILLPIMLLQDLISAWTYRRDWDGWNIAVTLSGAILGIGAAWTIAASVPDSYVRLTVGLIALAFALNYWSGRTPIGSTSRPAAIRGVFWGAVSGFTGTLANAGGPPLVIYVLPQGLEKLTFVGTMAIFFTVLNTIKLIPFFALGQLSMRNLATSAVLVPLAVATNFLGIWLVRKTPTSLFYKIAYLLVFLISLALIWQGVAAILQADASQ
jgi:uncharacterized membrane protein YfcA